MMANLALTARDWIAATLKHLEALERTDERLSHVASMRHGFEGWLKFEMAAVLCREPWGYQRWIGNKPGMSGLSTGRC